MSVLLLGNEKKRLLDFLLKGYIFDAFSVVVEHIKDIDYLVIAPENLVNSATTLSDYRETGGLASMTVALEDVKMSLVITIQENLDKLIATNPGLGSKLLRGMLLTVSDRLRKSFDRIVTFF